MKAIQKSCYPGSTFHQKNYMNFGMFIMLCLIVALILAVFLIKCVFPAASEETQSENERLEHTVVYDQQNAVSTVEEAKDTKVSPIAVPLLVNAAHPLPENFQLPEMVLLNGRNDALYTVKEPNTFIAHEAADALEEMLTAAHQDGLTVWQISEGYRSREDQQRIWDEKYEKYRTVNGLSEKKALQAVARRVAAPGTSEHETGLALDMTVPGEPFQHTAQCKWLAAHCHEYGFIIRYTEEKEAVTGITAEPWHIRYVGIEAAEKMKLGNLCLEEYVERYR